MTEPKFALLQVGDTLMIAVCPCGAEMLIGEHVVAQALEGGEFAALCGTCARACPEFFVAAEALNSLAAIIRSLPPESARTFAKALVGKVSRIAERAVIPVNVNTATTRRAIES